MVLYATVSQHVRYAHRRFICRTINSHSIRSRFFSKAELASTSWSQCGNNHQQRSLTVMNLPAATLGIDIAKLKFMSV